MTDVEAALAKERERVLEEIAQQVEHFYDGLKSELGDHLGSELASKIRALASQRGLTSSNKS